MHKLFLNGLIKIAGVKLIAKYKNEKIGFPYDDDIRIFFPDFHMYSKERQRSQNYSCYTNFNQDQDDLLPVLLRYLIQFKTAPDVQSAFIYQVGDFLDYWRETLLPSNKTPVELNGITANIAHSNSHSFDLIVGDNLRTTFLLGNHDFDLNRTPPYSIKWRSQMVLIRNKSKKPLIGVFHGDIFSATEKLPRWVNEFAVYMFSPKEVAAKAPRAMAAYKNTINAYHKANDYYKDNTNVQDQGPSPDLGNWTYPETAALEWNVTRETSTDSTNLEHFVASKKLIKQINAVREYQLKGAFIGHTHRPRIVVSDDTDDFFVLADFGCWIKKCKANFINETGETTMIEERSAHLGVLSQNEIRIYQLQPRLV
jgi:UDP-2,3-diacylglucosamine pyrophosphatase LpxH